MNKSTKILLFTLLITILISIITIAIVFYFYDNNTPPSRKIIKKYYYDTNTSECVEDVIGNFDTEEQCINYKKQLNNTPSPSTTPGPTPAPRYGCSNDGKCVKMPEGQFYVSNCQNSCTDKTKKDRLNGGESIQYGDYIQSPDYNWRLIMKESGIAVITSKPFLSEEQFPNSNTNAGNSGGKLLMTTDGNFVMQTDNGTTIWQTGTSGNGNYASIDNTGRVAVYSNRGTERWPNPPKPIVESYLIKETDTFSKDWSQYSVKITEGMYGCKENGVWKSYYGGVGAIYNPYVKDALQGYIDRNNRNFTISSGGYNNIFGDPCERTIKELYFKVELYPL